MGTRVRRRGRKSRPRLRSWGRSPDWPRLGFATAWPRSRFAAFTGHSSVGLLHLHVSEATVFESLLEDRVVLSGEGEDGLDAAGESSAGLRLDQPMLDHRERRLAVPHAPVRGSIQSVEDERANLAILRIDAHLPGSPSGASGERLGRVTIEKLDRHVLLGALDLVGGAVIPRVPQEIELQLRLTLNSEGRRLN